MWARIWGRFGAFVDRFVPPDTRSGEDRFKQRVLVAGALLCLPAAVLNAALYLALGLPWWAAAISLAWIPACLLVLGAVKRELPIAVSASIAAALVLATVLVLREATGGATSPTWAGVASVPVILAFLGGIRVALPGTAVVIAESIVHAWLATRGIDGDAARDVWLRAFVVLDLTAWLAALAWLYEVSRARSRVELEVAHQALRRAERLAATGRLAAGVAHEINNPLHAVTGATSLLQAELEAETPDQEQLRAYADHIARGAARAASIVGDLSAYAGQAPLETQRADARDPARSAVELTRFAVRRAKMSVTLDLPEPLPVDAAPKRLEQVFVNLLLNAVDASSPDSAIRVAGRDLGDEVELVVADEGEGLSTDDTSLVFEPFYTTKPTGEGTGLGLAICRGIIRDHRGRIEVTSAPGTGTTFRIRLPRAAEIA